MDKLDAMFADSDSELSDSEPVIMHTAPTVTPKTLDLPTSSIPVIDKHMNYFYTPKWMSFMKDKSTQEKLETEEDVVPVAGARADETHFKSRLIAARWRPEQSAGIPGHDATPQLESNTNLIRVTRGGVEQMYLQVGSAVVRLRGDAEVRREHLLLSSGGTWHKTVGSATTRHTIVGSTDCPRYQKSKMAQARAMARQKAQTVTAEAFVNPEAAERQRLEEERAYRDKVAETRAMVETAPNARPMVQHNAHIADVNGDADLEDEEDEELRDFIVTGEEAEEEEGAGAGRRRVIEEDDDDDDDEEEAQPEEAEDVDMGVEGPGVQEEGAPVDGAGDDGDVDM